LFCFMTWPAARSTLFPYTTLFRSYFESALGQLFDEVEQRLFKQADCARSNDEQRRLMEAIREIKRGKADIVPRFLIHIESSLAQDRKSTRLNSSHVKISYAVFCLK